MLAQQRTGLEQLHEMLGDRYDTGGPEYQQKKMLQLEKRRQERRLRTFKLHPKPRLSALHHWFFALLRYGSLQDFGQVQMGISQIAKKTRFSYRTVQYSLERFVRDGFRVSSHYDKSGRKFTTKLSPEDLQFIVCPKTLERWSGLTLLRRVHELQRERNVQIHMNTLRTVYLNHRITYKSVGYIFYSGMKTSRYERLLYAWKLKAVVDSTEHLVYVDESQFNMWMRKERTWAPRHHRIMVPI